MKVGIPRVLVLMAAYNGSAWIAEQVASILDQEGVDIQLVVSDDASSDSTNDILTARWGDDQRVRLVRQIVPSGSAGANFYRLFVGVELSDFEYVSLADQDDVWFKTKLATAVAALKDSNAAGYSASVLARWPDGREKVLSQCGKQRKADFLFEGAGQGCTFVLDARFFSRVQGFLRGESLGADRLHFHDWLLYLLSRAWLERWVFDSEPRMSYRQHGGNEIGARGGFSSIVRRFGMIRNGWYADQLKKAYGIYLRAGGSDPAAISLGKLLGRRGERRVIESASLAYRLLRDGRRRLSDRVVLSVSAMFQWV